MSEINNELRSPKAKNQTRNLADINRDLRLKSPAGQKAALDELGKRNEAKPFAQPAAVKPVVKQQPKGRLNVAALIAALSGIRSNVGRLIAIHEQDSAQGNKETLKICKAILAIEQSLKLLK